MGQKAHLEELVGRKEEEIALLESRVQAYIARTSLLQTRLLSTLDTLDVIQKSHEQELASISLDRDCLKHKLNRYTEVVRIAESERDDMRDAVLKLIEKVELSNDYSKWPHSQMFLSSLADIPIPPKKWRAQPSDEDDLLSYAVSMMETLRRERDNEKRAHVQTRELMDARILALEAKVSRREVELEQCVASADHMASLREMTPTRDPGSPTRETVSSEQIISMLDVTTARNKMLETEIKILARRLEQARAASPPPRPSDVPVAPVTIERASSSRRAPTEHTIPPSGNHQESRSMSLDQNVLSGLERQIKELGSKIDAFAEERKTLLQTFSSFPDTQSSGSPPVDDLQDRLHHLEHECNRLRGSEDNLRDQLNEARADARSRENELLNEISSLRLALDTSTRNPYHHVEETASNLLDELDDGEMSMELATPILPTSIISTHPPSRTPSPFTSDNEFHDQSSPYIDPPSIPLPPSPEPELESESGYDSGSPTLSQIMLNTPTPPPRLAQPPPSLVTELHRVQIELANTQHELEVGEEALNHLEDLIYELHSP